MQKTCRRCNIEYPLAEFIKGSKKSAYADGYQPWCSGCRRAYRIANRDRQRGQERAARYGISPQAQRELFDRQDHTCAACQDPIEFETAHLDHSHDTGEVRGFLCRDCNHALGRAHDSVERLMGLVAYLMTPASIARDYQVHDPTGERCRNDHPWAAETTYNHPNGTRHCILCRRESDRRRVKV